jgi:hypothetical protein
MSENVQEAIEFVKKNDMRFDGRQISYEKLTAYFFLLRELSNAIVSMLLQEMRNPRRTRHE